MKNAIIHGFLSTVILNLLKDKPLHGYGIKLAIYKRYKLRLPLSSIYPLLRNMERRGLIKSAWDVSQKRAKRVYVVTGNGEKELAIDTMELKVVVAPLLSQK